MSRAQPVAREGTNRPKSGVKRESKRGTKPLQAQAHSPVEGFPTAGKGAGIPYEPSSETDFLLKWVRKCLIKLHHLVFCRFASQSDDDVFGVETCGKASNDGMKS